LRNRANQIWGIQVVFTGNADQREQRITPGIGQRRAHSVWRRCACAVALHSMYYNFVRLHQTLKVSPAIAAGVTDRLWEMVDVVDVLDAFEVKQKRQPKVTFEIDEWRIGGGFYVRATLPDGTTDRIEGFTTESEAGRWIKNESTIWLHQKGRHSA
jgi:hypothetical protein